MSVTWHGLDEFAGDLRGFADDVADLPEQGQAGDVVAAAASAEAPNRTGQLAGSVRTLSRSGSVFVFATAAYAPPVIVGVPSHHTSPQPFIERALAAREAEVLRLLEQGVERQANEI